MTCIARGNVSDHRATKAVNACIKWFTDKLPTDLHEDELNDIVGNFIDIFSSKNAETVKKACNLMLRRKMNSMVTVKEAKQRDINQEHDEKMLDDAEDSKAGSHAKVHPARFKRPGFKSLKNRVYKNKLSLNSSVIRCAKALASYFPLHTPCGIPQRMRHLYSSYKTMPP